VFVGIAVLVGCAVGLGVATVMGSVLSKELPTSSAAA
jgi:hypothetical protein